MFILGQSVMQKDTRINRIQSILSFDFCVTTIIVTMIIDSGENPKKKNGKAKNWDEKKLEKEMTLNNSSDYQEFPIDGLKPKTKYLCEIIVTQENDPEFQNHKSVNDVKIRFTTTL